MQNSAAKKETSLVILKNNLFIFLLLFVVLGNFYLYYPKEICFHNSLQPDHIEAIEKTLEFIYQLPSEKLTVSSEFYKKHSTFTTRFGFPFSGKSLQQWINARVHSYAYSNEKNYIAEYSGGEISLSKFFFEQTVLDRAIILVHEARHADRGFSHIDCPKDFPYLSHRNLEADLTKLRACDSMEDGAYGMSASFIFEMIAFGVESRDLLVGKYNSEIARIIVQKKEKSSGFWNIFQ